VAKQYSKPPALTIDLDAAYSATLHTTLGDITIEFLAAEAPQTVNNFLFLAGEGFYDGVIFHRVIENFMIQGGDPTGTGRGGPGYTFRDELEGSGRYTRGTVAMANAGPNTNGSQFFICHVDTGLPHSYSIFGTVTDGMDVVDAIATLPTGPSDRPDDPPAIQSISVRTA
jgi:cyclophilin family peptidyl-prolyl cis-trans isomerase